MLLKKISYHNFRPFIGDQEINLSMPNKSKNVTVILGENTFGKSTFVLSFIWCLYGESRFSRADDILNKKVERRMKFGDQENASVSINFEDDGIDYTATRTQLFTMGANGQLSTNGSTVKLTYVANGQTNSLGRLQNEVNEAIASILPKDLASFFFFEGEKNNEIKKKDLGKAVRTLLGLEAFEKMKLHIHGLGENYNSDSVMGRYAEKISEKCGSEAKEALERKKKAEDALAAVQNEIREKEEAILSYEEAIEEINEQLRQAAPSKELQRRRDAIRNELKELEERLVKQTDKFLSMFSKDSLPLFVLPLLDKATSRLKKMDIADKGIKGIEATAITELLKRGVCLCGTDLKPGTFAYKSVEQYIDFIPPKNVGTLAREMFERIDETKGRAASFVEDFEEVYKEIQRIKVNINDLEREEKDKLAEIAKIGNIDTSNAENNLSLYKRRIREDKETLGFKKEEEGRLKGDIETAERQFNTAQNRDAVTKKFQVYFKYAEAIYNWLDKNYSSKEDEMRSRLNEHISSLFNSMYSGHRDISIDDKYNIKMTYDGDVVDDTGGLRVIQYFAYVGALVKLAFEIMKERMKDKSGTSQKLGEQYPLVLDAAFSHADETHTKNISGALASATHQLIFAIMRKDWEHAKSGLSGKVGRKYELQKIDETEVHIVEVL